MAAVRDLRQPRPLHDRDLSARGSAGRTSPGRRGVGRAPSGALFRSWGLRSRRTV
ncbi:hypothetical protein [Lysobacter gummosus]|uniref:hypothetical protein n=1 Tax=Lysobacter gummosus TaxID=262324 RepID=UPI00363A9034